MLLGYVAYLGESYSAIYVEPIAMFYFAVVAIAGQLATTYHVLLVGIRLLWIVESYSTISAGLS